MTDESTTMWRRKREAIQPHCKWTLIFLVIPWSMYQLSFLAMHSDADGVQNWPDCIARKLIGDWIVIWCSNATHGCGESYRVFFYQFSSQSWTMTSSFHSNASEICVFLYHSFSSTLRRFSQSFSRFYNLWRGCIPIMQIHMCHWLEGYAGWYGGWCNPSSGFPKITRRTIRLNVAKLCVGI